MQVESPTHVLRIFPELDVDRETVKRRGLWQFVQLAWPEIERDELVEGWHMEEICRHLEAVSCGELRRLIINVPPGMSKSTLVSALWPAWDWIHPAESWLNPIGSKIDGGDCVQIAPAGDQRETMSIYATTTGGRRLSVTVAGKGLGWHAHIQVVDDLTNPRDIRQSPEAARDALDRTWRWWTGTMASRKADPRRFARVIIQQRLHEEDLVGRILSGGGDAGAWERAAARRS